MAKIKLTEGVHSEVLQKALNSIAKDDKKRKAAGLPTLGEQVKNEWKMIKARKASSR